MNFSIDDRVFYGKVEGITDLVSFEGKTINELENAYKIAVDQHIEDCNK